MLLIVDYGVGLNLHKPIVVDEAGYLHDGVGGADVAEKFTMNLTDALPIFYACEQYASADHV
jgi:hypothetical protein